ncbi:MAG: hypothetical protein ACI8RD_010265, partial [Bacillariaceae sp.]
DNFSRQVRPFFFTKGKGDSRKVVMHVHCLYDCVLVQYLQQSSKEPSFPS